MISRMAKIFLRIFYCFVIFNMNGVQLETTGISDELVPSDEYFPVDLVMPGYSPKKDDDYVCISAEIAEPGYIAEFMPTASADRVHHMLAYGCNDPQYSPGEIWNCELEPICKTPLKILYAWARNAPSMALPQGVGVPIGRQENVGYLVLQIHYNKIFEGQIYDYSGIRFQVTSKEPNYLAGIYLLASGADTIPANTKSYSINLSCRYKGEAKIYPFAFRTHTHELGRVVSAYKYDSEEKWTKIGKANPQWTQRFYPVEKPITIYPGDILTAQCVYDSTGRKKFISIGAHGHDEMCNFYMYYYVEARHKDPFKPNPSCVENQRSDLFTIYPTEASRPFLADENWEDKSIGQGWKFGKNKFIHAVHKRAAGNRIGGGGEYGNGDGYGGGRVDPIYLNSDGLPVSVDGGDFAGANGGPGQRYGIRPSYTSHVRKKPGPGIQSDGRVVWRSDRIQNGAPDNGGRYFYSNDFGLVSQPETQPTASSGFVATENSNWLSSDVSFGQIAGLTFDNKGNIIIFHRVDRVWNENTFDETNRFREKTSGPIMDDPVITLSMSGNVISRWGRGFFYMPHGIFMDKNDNLWLTDVALHQVFKFDPKQPASKPALILGSEFEPGVDERHFCKPASVVVTGDGTIFIADGYCNNRIMKFNSMGVFINSWGEANSEMLPNGYPKLGSFSLPHYLSLHEATQRLFVADRENARVQIFFYNGTMLGQLTDNGFGSTVYAVSYCEALDTIFVLNGPSMSQTIDTRVFAFDGTSRRLMYSWRPQTGVFQRPHALASSPDCSKIFVGETGPNKLWRFDVNSTGRRASFNTIGKNFGDPMGARKPNTANDLDTKSSQNMTQLLTVLSLAIAVPVLIIAAICLCIRFRKRGGFRAMNMTANYKRSNGNKKDGGRLPLLSGAFRDRNGFQRLSTEDVDAMDEISDESETEDTLYPVAHKNSTLPQKA